MEYWPGKGPWPWILLIFSTQIMCGKVSVPIVAHLKLLIKLFIYLSYKRIIWCQYSAVNFPHDDKIYF